MNIPQFEDFFKSLKGKNVYVGFSGGADSRLIIELSNYFRKKYSYKLKAIHFEHGIRGKESIEDSIFCKNVCERLNIPIDIISLNIDKNTKNIECVAREKRLNYYSNIAKSDINHIILLGHHLDDKIENFFIRLSRGSNLSGLSSLKEYTHIEKIYIGRPLLSCSKKDIIDYMESNNIDYRTDSTNLNTDYNRNYLRNNLLINWFKKFSFVKGGVVTAIQNLEKDNDFIESYVEEKFEEVYKNYKLSIPIEIGFYLRLHDSIKFRILKRHIKLYDESFELTKGLFESFDKMIKNYDNTDHKTLFLNDKLKIVIKGYKLYFERNC